VSICASILSAACDGFYDQLGKMYASTASQHLHTKPAANQDSGNVSGSESTLRTVSLAHVLQEAKSDRASSQRTSPSVAGGPGGCSGLIQSPPRAMLRGDVSNSIKTTGGCGFPLRSARRVTSASHFIQENTCTS
jgi:hypothetical protein